LRQFVEKLATDATVADIVPRLVGTRRAITSTWRRLTMNPAVTSLTLALTLGAAPATLMRTVAEGSDSPIRERLEVVIRTPAEWEALSNRLAPPLQRGGRVGDPGAPPASAPIDFAHEMAVGVFVGPHHSANDRVDVFSVARDNGAIVVRYRVHRLSQSGAALQIDSAPYQVVAVPRDYRRVRFIEVIDLAGAGDRR
jgi:hypothetical protein